MKHALPRSNQWLKLDVVAKLYPDSIYVGEFPIEEGAVTAGSLFWQPNPPPEYSNYFMLYFCHLREGIYITSGEAQANKEYSGIITPNGDFIYSRHRHDYVEHDGCMIDGGDAYTKSNGKGQFIKFKIEKEKIKHV